MSNASEPPAWPSAGVPAGPTSSAPGAAVAGPAGRPGGTRSGGRGPMDWVAVAVPVVLIAVLFALAVTNPTILGIKPHPVVAGDPGLGDPYYPDAGNAGYDVISYSVDGSWDPAAKVLTASTTLTAKAAADLKSFYVDLYLDVGKVTVNGKNATVDRADKLNVKITPSTKIRSGSTFSTVISYAGDPAQVGQGESGWYDNGNEWTAAGEPASCAWWYPCNDHPSDPATFELKMRVPQGLQVVSGGRLVDRDLDADPGFDTWHWKLDANTTTYLTFMSIGHFAMETETVHGWEAVYAVSQNLSPADQKSAMAKLRTTAATLTTLETFFGPYPFHQIGGIVPIAKVWFGALETETRPIYRADQLLGGSAELISHENSHMWFGDNVTLRLWNDIFDNEGLASYGWWLYADARKIFPVQDRFTQTFASVRNNERFWRVTMTDPGVGNVFTTVYTRGPLALHALRTVMGDAAFFGAIRSWAQTPGCRSLEDWRAHMQAGTDKDLSAFFGVWLDGTTVPAQTKDNGFS